MHMVVAQPYEKYHIHVFCYSHVRAIKRRTRCYMTLVRSEHSKVVDMILELEIVGEPCVFFFAGVRYKCMGYSPLSLSLLHM